MNTIPKKYRSHSAEDALAHIVEECGEVLAAAGKTLRFGAYSTNPELPEGRRELNLEWVERELVDLERAIAAYRTFKWKTAEQRLQISAELFDPEKGR